MKDTVNDKTIEEKISRIDKRLKFVYLSNILLWLLLIVMGFVFLGKTAGCPLL